MLEKAKYIVCEGPIGAGKTSFARRLAYRLQAQTMLERPEANPFLSRFYKDMERYALPTQLAFLLQRVDELQQRIREDAFSARVVADFLFDKDQLFAQLNLDEDEYALYQSIAGQLKPQPPTPDLVIYLQAEPRTLMERVRRRGVESERRISETYVARVAERYARFFHQFDAAPVFTVNAERLNPVDEDDDFDLLLQHLYAMRGYREFFGYAQ